MALEVEIDSREGSTIVNLSGEIDLATAAQLREALASLLSTGQRIVVDLGGVTFIDSAGLHVLQSAAISLNGSGPLKIDNASPITMRVMGILGMTDHPDLEITARRTDG